MAFTKGANRPFSDTVTVSDDSTVTSTTSKTIAAANDNRIKFVFYNLGKKTIRIKLQPAGDDNDIKGNPVYPGGEPFILSGDGLYTGEISAIAEVGTQEYTYTEIADA